MEIRAPWRTSVSAAIARACRWIAPPKMMPVTSGFASRVRVMLSPRRVNVTMMTRAQSMTSASRVVASVRRWIAPPLVTSAM